ncbi:uncharacterized protein BO95DRAFT_446249 [Aspergillus brunneoviolaceus CBS 621.78]|uniref:Uncharacterized protein n=1 Tax=Aspergillus brunneoviolaceus CBS 621.78 TaxID=1450534 RepID=A0ACD1FZ11_9EURO|nr:hypothetical protein BO95DRAFT_446249 [Aspergillus brunneoviolaceus CBS 621.78]RAH42205.1 hypothetical protein BO95DRAFT_446249 [Aspergillus brunneoviolaceus CBS 621.78]
MADPEVTTEPAPSESAPSPPPPPPPPQEDEGKPPSSDPTRGSSPPPPKPKAQSASSLLHARRQLLAALRATDTTIERLDKLTTTAAGTERVLAVTGYLSHALHHLLASAPWLAFQTRLSLLARLRRQQRHLAQHSPSKPTPSAPPPPTTSPSTPNKPPLLALSSLMSETRYTLRLLGLLPLWTWGAATLRSPPQDRTLYILTLLQVLVNVIYQLLENGSYLAAKGILSRRLIDRWGGIVQWDLWSTRAWFGHIFLQFFVLARERSLRLRRNRQNQEGRKEGSAEAEDAREIRAWRKSLVNNVCWAPLCLHWCFEGGIGFPEQLTGLVSFMAGAWEVWDSWGRTTT